MSRELVLAAVDVHCDPHHVLRGCGPIVVSEMGQDLPGNVCIALHESVTSFTLPHQQGGFAFLADKQQADGACLLLPGKTTRAIALAVELKGRLRLKDVAKALAQLRQSTRRLLVLAHAIGARVTVFRWVIAYQRDDVANPRATDLIDGRAPIDDGRNPSHTTAEAVWSSGRSHEAFGVAKLDKVERGADGHGALDLSHPRQARRGGGRPDGVAPHGKI